MKETEIEEGQRSEGRKHPPAQVPRRQHQDERLDDENALLQRRADIAVSGGLWRSS